MKELKKPILLKGKCAECGVEVFYKPKPSFMGKRRVFCKTGGKERSECFLEYFKRHRNGFNMTDNFS